MTTDGVPGFVVGVVDTTVETSPFEFVTTVGVFAAVVGTIVETSPSEFVITDGVPGFVAGVVGTTVETSPSEFVMTVGVATDVSALPVLEPVPEGVVTWPPDCVTTVGVLAIVPGVLAMVPGVLAMVPGVLAMEPGVLAMVPGVLTTADEPPDGTVPDKTVETCPSDLVVTMGVTEEPPLEGVVSEVYAVETWPSELVTVEADVPTGVVAPGVVSTGVLPGVPVLPPPELKSLVCEVIGVSGVVEMG